MKSKKGCLIVIAALVLGMLALPLGFLGVRYLDMARREAAQPLIQIISPGLNEIANVQSEILVQVGATAQGSPVQLLQFYADGFLAGEQRGPAETLLGLWGWAPPTEGVHTLSFLAYNQEDQVNMASIQITAIPTADRDADGVPDAQDNCPDEAGPVASQGCMLKNDRDRDGLPDETDKCPDAAGDLEDGGCPPASVPDRDRDGVPDAEDRCPDIAGLPEWDGCPAGAWVTDRDGDGIPDFLDTCPDRAGTTESDGCPAVLPTDTDGDGVPDGEDACIDQPGPPESDGCPLVEDRDGDGIPDSADACPDEAGLEESGGCLPDEGLVDSDGDGVIDDFDLCPAEPGPIENDGCPLPEDRDGDGVPDAEDRCPDREGPADNGGCPYLVFDFLFESLIPALSVDLCTIFPAACDTDGDGVQNEEDACPDQAGLRELDGCPIFPQDQDGDGVLDEYDNCDTEVGDPAHLGCPDASDSDGDGLPLAFDACPDLAGPVENHGCPRAGRRTDVEIELLALNTAPGWVGAYCYLQVSGAAVILRVPESGLLNSSGEGAWSLPGDRRSTTMSTTEDGTLFADVLCWGQPGDPALFPQFLGRVYRTHGFGDWDNQMRHARGEGGGGWFEIIYHLCRGSCP